MKPLLLIPQPSPNLSFSIHKFTVSQLFNKWHYHSEIQLMHVIDGKGIRFVGDSVKPFRSNDLVLLGSNTPHLWKSDESYTKKNQKTTVIVIGFDQCFLGKEFLNLPEMKSITTLLEQCKRGIVLQGKLKKEIIEMLERMIDADSARKILLLLEILYLITKESRHLYLSSVAFSQDYNDYDTNRVNTIFNFALKNFKEKIELKKVAELVYMTPNSFCRFFKTHTQKSYSQLINEIRVSHACKLLTEKHASVRQVYLDCGYNNFTNFHNQFRKITGKTPLGYKNFFSNNEFI